MTIRTILGENGPQPKLCNGGGCPSAIVTTDDVVYVQGYELAKEERDQLLAPDGEGFVRMPLPVLKKIVAQLDEA